ncbi:hypothetical protein DFH08DRAFT_976776 [Mycena albidolilacea]|uniref:Transmembrane protein n=1 Tax=Mycena albidolilacea TaxID=1033008 RepID=A0AAD6Z2I3_9AGAR|nr:hypothetical protein DFH08DRAFT_976776 [Mycena albidolilacea]
MGGFVSRSGHRPIVTKKQIRDLPEYLTEICSVDAEDIQDKSKGDALSKGVAMIQGLWFTIQCLARFQQHLPVTNLEVATLAFAVVNVFIWFLWWNKPLDVQRPICDEESTPPPFLSVHRPEFGVHLPPLIMPSLIAGSEKQLERDDMPRRGGLSDVVGALIGLYDDFKPTTRVSVPSFWSSDLAGQKKVGHSFLIECFVGTLFGAVHCAVWNADFPSTDEMWMWRSSALFVSAIPVAFALATMAVTRHDMDSVVGVASSIVVFVLPIPIYIVARLFLIVVALISFRALPPAALTGLRLPIASSSISQQRTLPLRPRRGRPSRGVGIRKRDPPAGDGHGSEDGTREQSMQKARAGAPLLQGRAWGTEGDGQTGCRNARAVEQDDGATSAGYDTSSCQAQGCGGTRCIEPRRGLGAGRVLTPRAAVRSASVLVTLEPAPTSAPCAQLGPAAPVETADFHAEGYSQSGLSSSFGHPSFRLPATNTGPTLAHGFIKSAAGASDSILSASTSAPSPTK